MLDNEWVVDVHFIGGDYMRIIADKSETDKFGRWFRTADEDSTIDIDGKIFHKCGIACIDLNGA